MLTLVRMRALNLMEGRAVRELLRGDGALYVD